MKKQATDPTTESNDYIQWQNQFKKYTQRIQRMNPLDEVTNAINPANHQSTHQSNSPSINQLVHQLTN